MIRLLIVMLSAALLFGCSAKSRFGDEAEMGAAVYNYENTISADGTKRCAVQGTSAKEVPGVKIKISGACDLEVEAVASSPVGEMSSAILGLVNRIPVATPAP